MNQQNAAALLRRCELAKKRLLEELNARDLDTKEFDVRIGKLELEIKIHETAEAWLVDALMDVAMLMGRSTTPETAADAVDWVLDRARVKKNLMLTKTAEGRALSDEEAHRAFETVKAGLGKARKSAERSHSKPIFVKGR